MMKGKNTMVPLTEEEKKEGFYEQRHTISLCWCH